MKTINREKQKKIKEKPDAARVDREKLLDILPYLVAGVVAALWHVLICVSGGDDFVYFGTLLDGRSIWEILGERYLTWSSRMAVELVLIPLVHHVLLWRVLDTLVLASIPVMLGKLFDADRKMRWWITGFVLLYPFSDMVSAGWISTTVNYLWPLWCVLFVCVLLKKALTRQKLKWYEALGGAAACLFGSSQEQAGVILCFLLLLGGVSFWKQKRFNLPLLYLYLGINILSLVSIFLCPGNAVRKMQEIEGRMPEMAEFGILEKLYMGLVNIERIFIANINNVFLITAAILVIFVYIKIKTIAPEQAYRKTLVSGLPVLLLLGQSVIRTSHIRFKNIFVVPKQASAWNFKSPETWLPLLFLAVSIGGILYALFQLMHEKPEYYIGTVVLLGLGLASGVVMGFSPTIYASADRPYIYLYFILIFVCLSQLKYMQPVIRAQVSSAAGRLGSTVFLLFVLVNVADVTWLCYIMGRFL